MALPKKNAMNQILVPMVLSTDFATVKSGVTASQFNAGTRKFYGVNHGGSAAMTSGAISKLASLVRSGVFRLTLKAAECNYDQVTYEFDGVTSCALQIIQMNFLDNDDSDIASSITALASQLLIVKSMASDAASAAQQGNSRVLIIQSSASDAMSAAQQGNSRILVVQSMTSDLQSKLSDVESNLLSFLTTTGVNLNASAFSDVRSAITAGPAGALTVSDISDIASAVKVILASDMSDILSAVTQINSRVLVTKSTVSDVYSLVSDMNSRLATDGQLSSKVWSNAIAVALASRVLLNLSRISDLQSKLSDVESNLLSFLTTTGVALNASAMSDLRSAITAGPTGALTTSDISDIASAVRAALVSDLSDIQSAVAVGNSRALIIQSQASDLASKLSDVESNLLSLLTTTGIALNASAISDVASAVKLTLASDVSDILSAAQQTNSRVLVVQSMTSDLASKLSDVESNLLSFLTITGVNLNASALSDIRSAIQGVTVNLTTSDISDIASAVAAAVTVVTQSNISDIASAVKQILASDMSDILSAATQINSRALVIQSIVSDIRSHVSDMQSDFQSRVPKLVANSSQLSDIGSDLKSAIAAGGGSIVSDIYSLLSDLESNFNSRVPKLVANSSQLSDIGSDLKSGIANIAATALTQSNISDIASAVIAGIDLGDITDRLPSSLTPAGNMKADVLAVNGSLSAAVLLALSAGTMKSGTVTNAGFTPTEIEFEASDITTADENHWNGRSLIFLTGALALEATSITAYHLSTAGRGHFTVVALNAPPASGATFIIV